MTERSSAALRIVCIGWGSLLWKPGALALASPWQPGGPRLPLEFTRNSDDSDELALVITEDAPLMPTYWAQMAAGDLATARAQLRQREKISPDHPEWVGTLARDDPTPGRNRHIASWLDAQPYDAVVWTALPPKFQQVDGRAPSVEQALAWLSALRGEERAHAAEYLRRIPADIMTPYRTRFIAQLGWSPTA